MSYDDLDCPSPRGPRLTDLRGGCLPNLFTLPKEPETSYAVPKKIHAVWLDEDLPPEYADNLDTFRALNPDYEVTLWSDSKALTLRNRDVFDYEKNLGGKSDIFRYEALFQHGGIYIDCDTRCQRALDPDIFGHSFLASHVGAPWFNCTNAVMGLPAGSRFLDYVIRALPLNFRHRLREPGPSRTGPTFLTTCALSYADPSIRLIEQTVINMHKGESFMFHQLHANWVEKKR